MDFNPRSPCGERLHSQTDETKFQITISIHAPRVGSDSRTSALRTVRAAFQSTLPVWGATRITRSTFMTATRFQSTLPVWGATFPLPFLSRGVREFNPRSPCGERLQLLLRWLGLTQYFNPRSPCGERLYRCAILMSRRYFNPRSPCGERLGIQRAAAPQQYFNPRSPCGERPGMMRCWIPQCRDFNPRSPCGERLLITQKLLKQIPFQSTLPVWGATALINHAIVSVIISIHAPRVGSDFSYSAVDFRHIISIHAPRVGSDCSIFICYCRSVISIHAPRVGSDLRFVR